MDMRRRQPIGVELVKRGIVTENDIQKALEYQREHSDTKLGDILHILQVCDPQVLIQTIGDIVVKISRGTSLIISVVLLERLVATLNLFSVSAKEMFL